EEVPVRNALVAKCPLRGHIERLAADLALVLGRADFDAEAASGAVLGGNLQCVALTRELAPLCRHRLEGLGRACKCIGTCNLGPNYRVRANHDALAALD